GIDRADRAARKWPERRQRGLMRYPVVHIEIAGMVGIDDLRVNLGDLGLDRLRYFEQREGIEHMVPPIEEDRGQRAQDLARLQGREIAVRPRIHDAAR